MSQNVFHRPFVAAIGAILVLIGFIIAVTIETWTFQVHVRLALLKVPKATLVMKANLRSSPKEVWNDLDVVAVVQKDGQIIALVGREGLFSPYGVEGAERETLEERYVRLDFALLRIRSQLRVGSRVVIGLGIVAIGLWFTAKMKRMFGAANANANPTGAEAK